METGEVEAPDGHGGQETKDGRSGPGGPDGRSGPDGEGSHDEHHGRDRHDGSDDQSRATVGRRRWPYVVAATLGIVVLAAAWGWYGWWPDHRPGLSAGERFGVDVSNHQGEIDWAAVAGDDIDFAYIKATEGATFVDDWFDRNWQGARDVGLDVGAYHFFTLCRTGAEQADNFLSTVPTDEPALPAVIDLEIAGNCAERPTRAWVDREVGVFIDRVEQATGEPVVLYVGPDFDARYAPIETFGRPVWHRRLLWRPDVDEWWMWQFHYRARVAGIDGGADLNVMRGHHPDDT